MKIMRIKELREERGWPQEALAAALGVAPSVLLQYETEVILPKSKDLPLLAGVLDCEYNDLFAVPPYDYHTDCRTLGPGRTTTPC